MELIHIAPPGNVITMQAEISELRKPHTKLCRCLNFLLPADTEFYVRVIPRIERVSHESDIHNVVEVCVMYYECSNSHHTISCVFARWSWHMYELIFEQWRNFSFE